MHYLKYLAARRQPAIHPGGVAATRLLVRELRLEPGQAVLELGCGTGASLVRVASQPGIVVLGVEAMPEMLQQARRTVRDHRAGDRAFLVAADAGRLPVASASIDRAYAESVLGFQDAATITVMLRELRRALRPGGLCVLNDAIWKSGTSPAAVLAANDACVQAFGLRQASLEPWQLDDWRRAFQQAGFEIIRDDLLHAALAQSAGAARPASRRWRLLARRLRSSLLDSWLPGWMPGQRYGRALRGARGYGALVEARLFVLRAATGS